MNTNSIVKKQFNKQANNFQKWPVTHDEETFDYIAALTEIGDEDKMLDVACGTGAMAIYFDNKVKQVCGIDISDRMIDIAKAQAKEKNVHSVYFKCCDVENITYNDNSFTVVGSKAAFHHMANYRKVFKEMVRCCDMNGRIYIQDISTFENERVNDFFEKLECAIDASHCVTLSKSQFFNLYKENNIKLRRLFQSETLLSVNEYITHAVQEEESKREINDLLDYGLNDSKISHYFVNENNELFMKRNVVSILGVKRSVKLNEEAV